MNSSPARGEQADRDRPLNDLSSFDVKNDPARTTRRRHVARWQSGQRMMNKPCNGDPQKSLAPPPIARALVRRPLRRINHDAIADTSEARLRRRLVQVCDAWKEFQGSRTRDAVYGYLEAVSAIVEHYKARRRTKRAGLHTGEVEMRNGDIGGVAVHASARVMALSKPGEVLVSRVVTDLVAGAGLKFSDRGSHELKGLPGRWDLFAASL